VPPKGPAGPSVGKLGDVKCARGDGFRLPSVRSKQSKGISDKWLILRDRSSDSPANSLVKPARPAGKQSHGHETAHQRIWRVWRSSRHPLMRHIWEPPFCHPPHGLPGWLGVPAVLPHARSIPRACLGAVQALLAWSIALSCQHRFHFLLLETHSKRLRWVSRGFGLLVSQLWELAVTDLRVGWLPSRRKPSLCVGDNIFISASSLLSLVWLMLWSQWHLILV